MLNEPIVLSGWSAGIASDIYSGFQDIDSADAYSKPGFLQSGYRFGEVALDGTDVPDKIAWLAADPQSAGKFFCCTDDDGAAGTVYKVWKTTDYGATWSDITSATQSIGNGNGLHYHNGRIYYIAVSGGTTGRMDWYSGTTWNIADATYNFTTTTAPDRIPGAIGADGSLYLGIQNRVAKIDTANAYTDSALDLPSGERIFSMAALGLRIYLGARTSLNGNVPARIYPWDMVSDSFDTPIDIPYGTPYSMVSSGSSIYFLAGSNLTVYQTNGTSVAPVFSVPEDILPTDSTNNNYRLYPQSLAAMGDWLILAVGSGTDSASAPAYGRIFKYNVQTGALYGEPGEYLANTTSLTREYTCVLPTGGAKPNRYLVGTNLKVNTGSANGLVVLYNDVDQNRESDYGSPYNSLYSRAYSVGSTVNPITLERLSIELGAALTTGQGVQVAYRLTRTGIWTTLRSITYAADGSVSGLDEPCSITCTGFIQFKVSIKSNTSSTASPLLKSISIR